MSPATVRRISASVAPWVLTVVLAFGIGTAGASKLLGHRWEALFAGWGYPRWFLLLIGGVEAGGALCLLVPKLTSYASLALTIVMVGALATLLGHPAGPLGWGKTPAVYVILLVALARLRWSSAWSFTASGGS